MSTRAHEDAQRVASSETSADELTLYDHTSEDGRYDGRPSGELSDGDHDILESEDEREELLTQKDGLSSMLGRKGSGVKVGKWDKKKGFKECRKGGNEESSALMYEMEEGIGASNTSLRSRRSSESDEQRLFAMRAAKQVCQIYACANGVNEDYRHTERALSGEWQYTSSSSSSSSSSSPPYIICPPRKML